jgi:hypothetical protein
VVYNPNSKSRKIVAPKGFSQWLKTEDYDLFDASTFMNRSKDLIAEAIAMIPVEEIDPDHIIFEKVITGDAGDTVPSIWTWENKGRTYRVTPTKAARIYEIMQLVKPITDVYDLPNRATEVANGINSTCKQIAPADAIRSRLERNLKLVFLDTRIIPEDIIEKWKASYEQDGEKKLSAQSYDMNLILEGTRFISGTKTFEADIFSQFKL